MSRAFSCDGLNQRSRDSLAVALADVVVEPDVVRKTWRWVSLVLMIVYLLELA